MLQELIKSVERIVCATERATLDPPVFSFHVCDPFRAPRELLIRDSTTVFKAGVGLQISEDVFPDRKCIHVSQVMFTSPPNVHLMA